MRMHGFVVDQPCEAIAETLSATRSAWAGVAGFPKLGPPTKTPGRRLICSAMMTRRGKSKEREKARFITYLLRCLVKIWEWFGFPGKGEKKISFLVFRCCTRAVASSLGWLKWGPFFIWLANRSVTFSARLCESMPEAKLDRGRLYNDFG